MLNIKLLYCKQTHPATAFFTNINLMRQSIFRSNLLILHFKLLYIFCSTDMFQIFSTIGVHERQQSASLAFSNFGTAHRYVVVFAYI